MPVQLSAILKNSNVKGYLFFLLLTTVLAVIIKMAKTYDTTAILDVEIRDVPQNLVLKSAATTTLTVDYATTGFMLVANDIANTPLEIPFERLSPNDTKYELKGEAIKTAVVNHLSAVDPQIVIRPNTITFAVDSLAQKEVPVVARLQLKYSSGYGPSEKPKLNPDLITLIGASDVINTIDTVYTQEFNQEEVKEPATIDIPIDRSLFSDAVRLRPDHVSLDIKVTPFTEGTLEIPITVINADASLQLFPKQTKVFYKVPVDAFEEIRASDFKIICDFAKKNTATQVMLLEIQQKPEKVTEVRLGVNKVQYLIVNQ